RRRGFSNRGYDSSITQRGRSKGPPTAISRSGRGLDNADSFPEFNRTREAAGLANGNEHRNGWKEMVIGIFPLARVFAGLSLLAVLERARRRPSLHRTTRRFSPGCHGTSPTRRSFGRGTDA